MWKGTRIEYIGFSNQKWYNSPKVASEKLNISIDELYKYL